MNPYLPEYPRYLLQLLGGFRAAHERALWAAREHDIHAQLGNRRLRILDLANGRLRPQYTLLRDAGHEVYGIDLVNRPRQNWNDRAYQLARQLYRWRLGLQAPHPGDDTLVCGDAGCLPFPAASFDLVTSIAAFEHFLNVPAVIADCARVTRPGGMVWICVHLFSSLSGGHNVSFTQIPLHNLPPGIEPWDHLRKRRLPFVVPLNQWRKDQYLAEFACHFSLVNHYCLLREGDELLTPEIQTELAEYTRDELTCASLVIVGRKLAAPTLSAD